MGEVFEGRIWNKGWFHFDHQVMVSSVVVVDFSTVSNDSTMPV